MKNIMLLLMCLFTLTLVGCVKLGSKLPKTTMDGVDVEVVSSDRFRIYGENLKTDNSAFINIAEKICEQYTIVSSQNTQNNFIEIQCTDHVLNYNSSTQLADFVKGKTSEYAIRAAMDAGGEPIDIFTFHDTKPASKILFYKRFYKKSYKVFSILLTNKQNQSTYIYQYHKELEFNEFDKIRNTSKYIQRCKEWYSDELAKNADNFKSSGQTDKYAETILFLENEISPLGETALKELSLFYSDSKNQQYNNPQKKIFIAEQMVLRDRSSATLNSLSIAYADSGDFNKATEIAQQAISLSKNDNEKYDLEIYLDMLKEKKVPSKIAKSDLASYYYDKGIFFANTNDSRKAFVLFAKAFNVSPDYKDAAQLRDRHKRIADETDAEILYQDGLKLLKDSKFQDAATAFNKSQEYIPGYKDSAKLEEEAKNVMPSEEQLRSAVERALRSKIPISWVGNLMGGSLQSLDDLQVARLGIYNKEKKYWPIKIRCIGVAALQDPFNPGKLVRFDKVGDFIVFQDDYGDWQASMRGDIF